jgi:L-fuculose-phosphate aldolase
MPDSIAQTRAHIARIGALLFARQLTDSGGGNISVRVEDKVCISPRYSGQKYLWALTPEDVMVVDLDGNILEGTGELSRESRVHLSLHRNFGEYGNSVIHCHPRHLLVFAAMARPMPPALEGTLKFGTIPVTNFAPAHSPVLAENVTHAIRGQESRIRKHAAACIAPWHGVFCMGKDLNATFDAVERLDTNAYVLLTGHVTQEHLDALQAEAKKWDKQ